MESQTTYKRFRPAPYTPKMQLSWWWQKPTYFAYIMRELTAVFVAAYAVILLLTLRALSAGEAAWEAWTTTLQSPLSIGFHVVALLFAVYHSITWFMAAPTAIVLNVKGKPVPAKTLILAHVVIWIVCSAAIAGILLTR